ncbi:MAG: PAS/PAC sensor hybrid histidine kinase [candidate division CPR2 bacterium GW2011_GWC1_39_9]|uniref:PAS/PAC sensor hybrid histidine kinase n=1 Tax=candidate division CPR2 bacterium GW2011_GWC2_39_10 TaxID=1618345 RepID=A0A0G0PV22_UNCC2|nr:MAG: PAS/PAC sensor hybrid histidine kinase [candidate division CPR2 bacterium GW2011_GWC2_39_10]KKR33438.1 MAG: PAS/PAC sensor hybrid histidine kinase [candidate division CPR2 bacterium GW2011_GWC1_39_9]
MKKILIVEDDFGLAEMYRQKFVLEGFEVEVANNGQLALEKLMTLIPNLILLDIMMPGIGGQDVLDIIRNTPETKDAAVIVMTNLDLDSVKERVHNTVEGYIRKSDLTPKEVVEKVTEILNDLDTKK